MYYAWLILSIRYNYFDSKFYGIDILHTYGVGRKTPLCGAPYQQLLLANSSKSRHINELHKNTPKRLFSGSALIITSWNIENINSNKEELLAELCRNNSCNVLCVKEAHFFVLKGNRSCAGST